MIENTPAADLSVLPAADPEADDVLVQVEHPIGQTGVLMNTSDSGATMKVSKSAIVRTARKLFSGRVYPSVNV